MEGWKEGWNGWRKKEGGKDGWSNGRLDGWRQ
jgi:hypothetical protein